MSNRTTKTAQKKWAPDKLKVLDICQHIHKHSEELYQYLAEIHRGHGEIARIWGLVAVDKCNHADTFKMASRLKGEGISEIYLSPDTAESILAKIKTVLKGFRRNPPSVLDALGFAVKMEENLNNVQFRHVVKLVNDQDVALMTSSLRSSGSVVHMLTEEYVNLTLLG
jgi:rubrerythrin